MDQPLLKIILFSPCKPKRVNIGDICLFMVEFT